MTRSTGIAFCLILISLSVSAQRRIAADREVKTVFDGKVTTVRSEVFCQASGEMVTVFQSPYPYYVLTNPSGEFKLYVPSSNEVYTDRRDDFSSKDDILYLFMTGKSGDMGLSGFGYRLSSTENEDGLLKRTYVPTVRGKGVSKVELVLEAYLPIYLAYYDEAGNVLSRTYLSAYSRYPRFALPQRATTITYTSRKDSVIVRTQYSRVRVDGDDPMFGFEVPADAKPTTLRPGR